LTKEGTEAAIREIGSVSPTALIERIAATFAAEQPPLSGIPRQN